MVEPKANIRKEEEGAEEDIQVKILFIMIDGLGDLNHKDINCR